MKKLLLLLFVGIVGIGNAQTTAIPDANFEQVLIDLGLDAAIDGAVITASIDTLTILIIEYKGISDLTGIEDFTALTGLNCSQNQLTSLDLTQNTALTGLNCSQNQLTSLDLTQNTALTWLYCYVNQLTCLNVKNGNNLNVSSFDSSTNPNLNCVEVDDPTWSTTNWLGVDAQTSFSTNCNNPCSIATDILESSLSNLSLYPNPSNTGLIQLNTSITNSDINVYSIEGKQIKFTQSNNVIDISESEKGVYLISIDGVVMRYVYQE